MEGNLESGSSSDQPLPVPECESKIMAEKRPRDGLDATDELAPKRVKMRDVESLMRSSETKEVSEQPQEGEDATLKNTDAVLVADSDETEVEESGGNPSAAVVKPTPEGLDLNVEAGLPNNTVEVDSMESADKSEKTVLTDKHAEVCGDKFVASTAVALDLNAEDMTSSANQDPFHAFRNFTHLKASDVSECGSTTCSQEEKDPMVIWNEMKQNGFLSSSHGGVPIPVPKQRGRKPKNDTTKKKSDVGKKDQADRFAKMAAPSGLLNELNPGIINHVRNRKQVHSIIEALVKSEKHENTHLHGKQKSHVNAGTNEGGNVKDADKVSDLGAKRLSFSHNDGHMHALTGERQGKNYNTSVSKTIPFISENKGGHSMPSMPLRVCSAQSLSAGEDETLALKLSSAAKSSEMPGSSWNEESANNSCVSSLTVKAASVAFQWLELLQQDIKGRLAALRRSKKKVRAVITTELPFLISKEFPSNQENDPNGSRSSADGSTYAMHVEKWSALFSQMENSLSEEEIQLESMLNQVRDMHKHCEMGLQQFPWTISYSRPQSGSSEDSGKTKVEVSDRELAMRAAAASIYSTCNYLSSNENVSCC